MIAERNFAFGASTPWKRIRCKRGRGTSACQALHEFQRRHDEMGGTVFVRTLQLQHDIAGAATLEPLIGDRRTGDIAARVLKLFVLIGAPAYRRMRLKPCALAHRSDVEGLSGTFCRLSTFCPARGPCAMR